LSDVLNALLLGALATGLVMLGYWLFISTEGVYLGRRVVIWLYDLYAHRYDAIKNYQHEYERLLLARPIMATIAPLKSPLVLDVATGTGRLPLALLAHEDFQGHMVGIDLSRRMLSIAAGKLQPFGERVSLIWCPAETLPFEDGAFDVVTCLEALEFMTAPERVLGEAVRVLRPGGLLLVTNRIHTRLMPGKIWTSDEARALLRSLGVERVEIDVWQADYDQVWGLKDGESAAAGARPLAEILRCPICREHRMALHDGVWVCAGCGGKARVGGDGVIELFPLLNRAIASKIEIGDNAGQGKRKRPA